MEEASKGEEESSQDRIPARNIQKDTAEFRNLLLYGRKKVGTLKMVSMLLQ